MTKKSFWLLTLCVIILSIGLRFWSLGSVPSSLYWDEQAILLDAWSVATTGTDWHASPWFQAIFASYGDFKLPVYIWLASLSVKLFGVSYWAIRLPSALAGIFGVILVGCLIGDLIKLFYLKINDSSARMLIWTGMFVAGTSFWDIHFSHVGFEGHLGQWLLSLSLWLFIRILLWQRQQGYLKLSFYLFTSGLVGALSIFSYYSVRFVLPLLVLVTTGFSLFMKKGAHLKRYLLAGLFVFVFIIGGMLVFDTSPLADENSQLRLSTTSVLSSDQHILRANQIQQIFNRSLISRVIYHRETFRAEQLLKNLLAHLSPDFLYLTGDTNLRHGTYEHGLLSLLLLPFGVLGLWYLWKVNKPLLLFLVGWWGLGLLPAAVPLTVPHALRSLNSWVPMVIVHSFGLFYLWLSWRKFWFWLVATLLLLDTIFFLYEYQTQYLYDSSESFQSGYAQVAEYVTKQQSLYSQVWVIPFDGRWFLWLLSAQKQPPTLQPNLVRDGYGIKRISNIYLQKPSCADLHLEDQLVVGQQVEIKTLISDCFMTDVTYFNVTSQNDLSVVAITTKKVF